MTNRAVPSTSGLTIAGLRISPLDLPLREPFGISGGSLPMARNVLVTVTLENGVTGCGEAAPLPAYNGETQEQVLADLKNHAAALLGQPANEWQNLTRLLQTAAAGTGSAAGPGAVAAPAPDGDVAFQGALCGSALCALETAVLDAYARASAIPLWRFFGGASTELETDMTVTTGDAAHAEASAAAILRRGIRIIKVKVGGQADPSLDIARLSSIRRAAPDAPLILDGNAGLSRGYAAALVSALRDHKIIPALLEQWLEKTDLAGLRALHEETGWPVAADESVVTAADAARVADAGAAQVINIKLMKAGIAEALRVISAAKAAGLALMIGGNVESILGMTTSACLAAGLGGFSHADLDTPLFLAENPFQGGYRLDGGRISVAAIAAGHGVQLLRPLPCSISLSHAS